MKADDIPLWVPDTVRIVALGQGIWNNKLHRFLTHRAMQKPWHVIRRQKVIPSGIQAIDYSGILGCYDLSDKYSTSLSDQACAALFVAITTISMRELRDLEGRETVVTVESLKVISEPFQKIVDGLNFISESDPCWPLPVNDDVKRAMETVKSHCEKRIEFISQKKSPYLVERSTAEVIVRGHVRAIGVAMHTLYGNCLYGTVATIANVMFDPKVRVTTGQATKWCTKPPLPISGAS